MSISLTSELDGTLVLRAPFSAGFNADLKMQVPYADQRWDWNRKVRLIAPQHGGVIQSLIRKHYGARVELPKSKAQVTTTTQLVEMRYIGRAKDRGGDEPSAYGWANEGWTLLFPLSVLRRWWEPGVESRPDEAPTYYGILGVARTVPQVDLKKAYRRVALQWHPDRCKEPDATTQFQKIQEAYEVLNNPALRLKYDAGLKLEASLKQKWRVQATQNVTEWRPPVRCGWLLVEGQSTLGRINVSKILQWNDIIDNRGKTLITFWIAGDDKFSEEWV